MIVLVHECDFGAHVSNIFAVDLDKCPARLRMLLKEGIKDPVAGITFEDSISFSDNYGPLEDWVLKAPYTVDKVLTWEIY